MSPSDNDLRSLLQRVPRAAPPAVPVERIVARLRASRLRRLALAGVGATIGGILLALALRPPEPAPPVLLQLRVVDVPEVRPEEEPATPGEPREVRLP